MQTFKFKTAPSFALVILLPLLLALGFWQLDRAKQKKQFLLLQQQRQNSAAINLSANRPENVDDLLYLPARVAGRFDSTHQILQNNQMSEGKSGYFVLTPFIIQNSEKAILVNRGWIPAASETGTLPDLRISQNELEIQGHINRFSRPGIILAGADKSTESCWPAIVQVINTAEFAEKLEYNLFNFQLELDKNVASGFQRNWQHSQAMPPEKHVAYAVQWFLLALTITVLYTIYGIERK